MKSHLNSKLGIFFRKRFWSPETKRDLILFCCAFPFRARFRLQVKHSIPTECFSWSYRSGVEFIQVKIVPPKNPDRSCTSPRQKRAFVLALLSSSASFYSALACSSSAWSARAHTSRHPPQQSPPASTTAPPTSPYSRSPSIGRASPVQASSSVRAARTCASP